jgi:putative ABC transport system permease protein
LVLTWLFRELRAQKQFAFFFVLNLLLGLTGLICLNELKSSLDASIQLNAKSFLAADLAITTRRRFAPEEIEKIAQTLPSESTISRSWEFLSMVRVGIKSRLIQVKAVDENYPLFGKLVTQPTEIATRLEEEDRAWIEPELLAELGVTNGSVIALDQIKLKMTAIVNEDSTRSLRFTSFAPRMYIGRNRLARSGWIGSAATLTDTVLIKLKDDRQTIDIKTRLQQAFSDPGIRVTTAAESATDTVRFFHYLADYLGLVSLVAFLLASIGCGYLVQRFLQSRRKETAILHALGLTKTRALLIYLAQVTALGLIAAFISVIVARALGPLLVAVLQPFSPVPIAFAVNGGDLGLAIGLTIFSCLTVAAPLLMSLRSLDSKRLLLEDEEIDAPLKLTQLYWFTPGIFGFYFLAVLLAHSWRTGSLFFGGLITAVLLLLAINTFVLGMLAKVRTSNSMWQLSIWHVTRKRGTSLTMIATLSLGILLIDLIPQIQNSLQAALITPDAASTPSLFLFDIQEEQRQALADYVKKQGIALLHVSPLIRARILKINDEAFERTDESTAQTREEEGDSRFRNRGVNLSYREELSASETITAGRPLRHDYSEAAPRTVEISVESGYAKRLGLKLHDHVVFDIQGVEMEAEVANLRKVNWTSFQPNFFILIEPGVLNAAPKTWIASLPPVDREKTQALQNQIVTVFPNVSIVDIRRTIEKIVEIASQISMALLFLGVFVFICGLTVVTSMSRQQAHARLRDYSLLKLLGARKGFLSKLGLQESMLIGGLAVFQALSLSALFSYALMRFVFEDKFIWSPKLAGLIGLSAFLCFTVVNYWFTRQLARNSLSASFD